MSKYTKGPWQVSGGDVWPVNGNPRVKICTMTKPSPMNMIDWKANARLLAAAPEMLLALEIALEFIDGRVKEIIAEAITKAKGE